MVSRYGLMRWLAFVCALAALLVPVHAANAQSGDAAIDKAVAYIRSQQQTDGSFAGFGAASTADAVFALAAANVNVTEVQNGGKSPIDFIRSQAKGSGKDAGVAAKFVIAMLLAGQSPVLPDGTNLVQEVQSGYKADTARYGNDVTSHAYAIVALVAAGEPAGTKSEVVDALKTLQLPDGGWSFDGTPATGSDTNTTSVAIQALVAAGDKGESLAKAVAYLRAQQNADGGFPYSQTSQFGNASDANSTALSLQALIATGEDLANYTKEGKTPRDRLLAFQNPSGAFRYQDAQPEDNAFATYQAVPALAGKTLPLEGIAIALPAPSAPTTDAPAVGAPASPAPAASIPATPAGGTPAQLPNTGAEDTAPVYAVALLAMMLVMAGLVLKRRRV